MEQRRPPEYILEVFADPTCVKAVVKGILHTIFFHRYFPSIRPESRELFELDLPYVDDVELETLIDQRTTALIRQIDTTSNLRSNSVRGQIAVQLFEKRRRKAWFSKAEEEVCWEQWTLDVTLATPRTESERAKVRRAMEMMLQKTAMRIVTIVNRSTEHIPPITTSEANPFPYQIIINPRDEGRRIGHHYRAIRTVALHCGRSAVPRHNVSNEFWSHLELATPGYLPRFRWSFAEEGCVDGAQSVATAYKRTATRLILQQASLLR